MAKKWKPTPKQQSVSALFGIDLEEDSAEWNIRFGTQLVSLENQDDMSPDGRYYPTTKRLIAHTGMLEDVYNDPEYYAMLQARPMELARRESDAGRELEQRVLAPLRKQMELRYYFSLYRSGSIIFAPDEKTGLVAIKAMGEPMVKVIPLSVEVAQMRGADKPLLRELAPEAIYVLEKKKVAHGAVRTEDTLLALLDGWLPYIPDVKVSKRLYQSFKKMTPCIVGKRVTQLLLPGTRR